MKKLKAISRFNSGTPIAPPPPTDPIIVPPPPPPSTTIRHVGTGQTYATVQAAVAAANIGDVVQVHAGTYTRQTITANKTDYISVIPFPGDVPVVAGFWVDSGSYVDISGFRTTAENRFRNGAHHAKFRNFNATTGFNNVSAFYIPSGLNHDLYIEDNIVTGLTQCGVQTSGDAGAQSNWSYNVYIRRNTISGCYQDCMFIDGIADSYIEYNSLSNTLRNDQHNDGIQCTSCNNLWIRWNHIFRTDAAPTIQYGTGIIVEHANGNTDLTRLVQNIEVSGNIIENWHGSGLIIDGIINGWFFNNTVYNNFGEGSGDGVNVGINATGIYANQGTFEIYNNIIESMYRGTGGLPTYASNNHFGPTTMTTVGSSISSGDPKFSDLSYHLQNTSPCIDTGITRTRAITIDNYGSTYGTIDRGAVAATANIVTPPPTSSPLRMIHLGPSWDTFLVSGQQTNFENNIAALVGYQGTTQWNLYKTWNLTHGIFDYLNTWSDTNASYAVYQNDSDGAALYNPFASNERRAMDLRSTTYRNGFVAECIAVMDDGGDGMFFDDMNLSSSRMFKRVDGSAPLMDLDAGSYYTSTRTGQIGYYALLGDFYKYVTETVRAARPAAKFIGNPVWTDISGSRWLDARWSNVMSRMDWICIEHGAADSGLNNGATSTSGFALRSQNTYIDQIHALGVGIMNYADSSTSDARKYEMARYLDKRDPTQNDMIGIWEEYPRWPNYDPIFDTDFGSRLTRNDTNIAGAAITSSYSGGTVSYTPVTFASTAITASTPVTPTLQVGFSVLSWQWPASYPTASVMSADGFNTIRGDVQWKDVETTTGARNWSSVDAFILSAAQRGLKVLPILDTSAPPYQTIAGEEWSPPTNNSAFGTFCRDAVSRYRAGGAFWTANPSVTAQPWDAVEIWNEPYYGAGFWRPNANVAGYQALFIAAYNAIRTVDSTIKIGLESQPKYDNGTSVVDWSAVLFSSATIKAMTNVVYMVHPYPAPKTANPATDTDTVYGFSMVKGVRDLAVAAGINNPRIWVTEVGWPYASPLSNSLQAQYNAAAVNRCQGEWGAFVDRYYGFIASSAGYPEDMFTGTTDRGSYASMKAAL